MVISRYYLWHAFKEYETWVASNGKNLIPDFVEIGHLVQKMKGAHTAWSHVFYFSRQESRVRDDGRTKVKHKSTNSHNTSHVFWKVQLPSLSSTQLTATMTVVSLSIRTTVHSLEILTGLINSGFSWLWLCIFYQLCYILKLPTGAVNTVLSLKLLINMENDSVFFRDSTPSEKIRESSKFCYYKW